MLIYPDKSISYSNFCTRCNNSASYIHIGESLCKKCFKIDTKESMYNTIIHSKYWREWSKHVRNKQLFDISECEECGIIGKEHFEEFMQYFINKK